MKTAHYAAIVLAAGFSERMNQFKPLLLLGNETIADHVISTFLSNGVEVILVVGHRQKELAQGIKSLDITIIENPEYQNGMFSSIQAGVRKLRPVHKAFFVMPVDIPLVRPSTIKRLLNVAAENPDKILYPTFNNSQGHPPLILSTVIPDILGWNGVGGLKAVIDSREKEILRVKVADSNILYDIDTPDDYHMLLERFRRHELPNEEECKVILKDICQTTPDIRQHCIQVSRVALQIGKALNTISKIDIDLVRAAALLHDIAKGQPEHDIAGRKMLRELGFDEVGDIVGIHTDLSEENADISLEAKIVYLADKFVQGKILVSIEERYRMSGRQFGLNDEIKNRILQRKQRALKIKQELENLLGYPLEAVIFR